MADKRLEILVNKALLADFDMVAKSNLMNRSVYLRTLMVAEVKKAYKQTPGIFAETK